MEQINLGQSSILWDGQTLQICAGAWTRHIHFLKGIPMAGPLTFGEVRWPQRALPEVPVFALPGISLSAPAVKVGLALHKPFHGALEHLRAEVLLTEGSTQLRWCLDLWEGHGAMRSQVFVRARPLHVSAKDDGGPDMPLETDPAARKAEAGPEQSECVPLGHPHLKVHAVKLYDRTDDHDSLVEENLRHAHPIRWENFDGNFFLLERYLTGVGMLLVKEGPTVEGSLHRRGPDLRLLAVGHALMGGTGLDPATYDPDREQAAHAWTLLCGHARDLRPAYRRLQSERARVSGRPRRYAMSNTWGDRNRDAALNEAFMLREIGAAAEAGANLVMIDDGWQKGRTSNSALSKTGVWESYWQTQPDFWQPDLGKFPGGLSVLANACRDRGARLCLWYSPDSSDDFSNWEKDARTLLDLRRDHGIAAFKLDGIHLRSRRGESRIASLFETLHREAPDLILCLDVTAQVRPGYLPWPEHVHLFVENRYTDWGNYHPHRTLRNTWMLGRWLPVERLQMEILNPRRCPEKYEGDPLAPGLHDMAYVAACAVLAQPLLWMEVQHLPPEDRTDLRRVLDAFRGVLEDDPVVEPLGAVPDGMSWTGFRITGSRFEHLLVFREWNDEVSWAVPGTGDRKAEILFSNRSGDQVRVDTAPAGITVRFDQKASFALLRLQ